MATWAAKRRFTIVFIIFAFIAVLVSVPVYKILNPAPTCFNGAKNQGEKGVDCGGPCEKVCEAEIYDPIIFWSRSSRVKDGFYNAVAFIENPNIGIVAYDVPYSFKLYDGENFVIWEKEGVVSIPANKRFPVFQGSIPTGQSVPARSYFRFTEKPNWIKREEAAPKLSIKSKILSDTDRFPRLDVVVENKNIKSVEDVDIVAIIFDADDNVIASSKTYIEKLDGNSSRKVTFTWPEPLEKEAVKIESYPLTRP